MSLAGILFIAIKSLMLSLCALGHATAKLPYNISECSFVCLRVVNRRRELLPEMRAAGEHGKSMYLSLDKLIIKDRLECQQ